MAGLKNQFRILRVLIMRLLVLLRGRSFFPENGPVCILAPHPDDEALGCGGLISRLCGMGEPPHVIILTGGEQSHAGCCALDEKELAGKRRQMAVSILSALGVPPDHMHLLNFPDGKISCEHPEFNRLSGLVGSIRPETLFIPHHGEGWHDHVIIRSLAEALPGSDAMRIMEYCVWLWFYNVWRLDWRHACFLKLSRQELGNKRQAVHDYVTPAAPCERPWSGSLPKLLVQTSCFNRELFFKIQ